MCCSAAAAAAACIVPGSITVYGCPLAYEVLASNKIQLRGAIRHGNCFSLLSSIDQTNEHHLKLMTVCLNCVLHDLDGEALRVARVGFTFRHFRSSPSGGIYTHYVFILTKNRRKNNNGKLHFVCMMFFCFCLILSSLFTDLAHAEIL